MNHLEDLEFNKISSMHNSPCIVFLKDHDISIKIDSCWYCANGKGDDIEGTVQGWEDFTQNGVIKVVVISNYYAMCAVLKDNTKIVLKAGQVE
ncbi:hypothetical protein F8538_06230 [Edwardsiella ictaluri]|uniref:hypothetical protein n=1 Tax=Edwardsiella ictaluri TaxID=67780 RepID=UPI0018DDC53A|nr:hypothetical protein [Edwardsiella ictaluri]QPW26473.1 hypothetical protein F8538_06230 [Edwardsiella ictaluri]